MDNGNSNTELQRWEKRFSQDQYFYGEEANVFIQEAAGIIPRNASVAAYAEGEGRNAVFLAKQGFAVTAYEYTQSGIKKTQALAEKNGVQVKSKPIDLIHDPLLSEAYDAAIMVFGHFPQRDQYNILDKILGSVKPGGLFLMEAYEEAQVKYGTGGPSDTDWLYNAEDLLRWSKKYRLKHFFAGETERHEGERHSGQCFVVQVVVEK